MKRLLMVLLPILVLLLGGLSAALLVRYRPVVSTEIDRNPPPLIEALDVSLERLEMRVRTQGTVAPRTESTLVPEVPGRVVWISASLAAGGFFEADDVLVKLDRRDFELAAITTKSRVARARLTLAQQEAEAEVARKEWKELALEGREPSPLTLREPQVEEARAALAAAQADLEKAERDLARTEIRAPYAGRVRTKNVDVGQFVPVGASIARLYAVDYAEIRLPILTEDLAYLDLGLDYEAAEGPEVSLSARLARQRRDWNGRIVRTEGELDPRTRMIYVVARVEDPYGRLQTSAITPLAVGLFVDAEIVGKTIDDLVVLPRGAVRGDGRDHVLVIDAENRLRFRRVEVFRRQGEEVLVSGGLQEGERICISRLDVAVDGMRVRLAGEDDLDEELDNETAEELEP